MTVQIAYAVNCTQCGGFVNIINPRLGEQPVKVWPTTFGLTLLDRFEIVRTRCPHCKTEVWAKFQYR